MRNWSRQERSWGTSNDNKVKLMNFSEATDVEAYLERTMTVFTVQKVQCVFKVALQSTVIFPQQHITISTAKLLAYVK